MFDVTAHYAQPRIPLPAPRAMPGGVPPPFFPAPDVLEDPRSLFLGYLYTFSKLPETPMQPRLADSRIGHFTTSVFDFGTEAKLSPVRHYVHRWRLEKKDPADAISEPVKPITFWLSNEIPEKYREPIRAGILEWNKAFEKVGFRDAVVVKQQPDDSDVDLLETGYSSVRWQIDRATDRMARSARRTSIRAPARSWMRTSAGTRTSCAVPASSAVRRWATQSVYDEATGDIRVEPQDAAASHAQCMLRDLAVRELGYTLALLEARGEIEPDSPQADAFVNDFIRWVTMHEVGHTLGLAHNFRASTVNSPKQLTDAKYTATAGLIGSVMDYPPANIALEGEPQGQYYATALGRLRLLGDRIRLQAARSRAGKRRSSTTIAARASEPQLAFATDADASAAIDPHGECLGPGLRPARVLPQASPADAGTVAAPGSPRAGAG